VCVCIDVLNEVSQTVSMEGVQSYQGRREKQLHCDDDGDNFFIEDLISDLHSNDEEGSHR
jgi:hypothetical protein